MYNKAARHGLPSGYQGQLTSKALLHCTCPCQEINQGWPPCGQWFATLTNRWKYEHNHLNVRRITLHQHRHQKAKGCWCFFLQFSNRHLGSALYLKKKKQQHIIGTCGHHIDRQAVAGDHNWPLHWNFAEKWPWCFAAGTIMNNQYPPTLNRKIAPWGLGKRGSLIPKAQNSTTQHYPMASPRKAQLLACALSAKRTIRAKCSMSPSPEVKGRSWCRVWAFKRVQVRLKRSEQSVYICGIFFHTPAPVPHKPIARGAGPQRALSVATWAKLLQYLLQDHSEMFERPVFVFVPCTSPAPFYHMLSLLGRRLLTGCGLWLCSLRIQICHVVCWVCRVRCTETGPEAVPSRRPMVPVLFIIAQVSSSHQFVSLLSKFLSSSACSGGNFNPSNQHPV